MRNILILCFSFGLVISNAQNEFKVRRGFKIDRSAPIYNIHVDEKGLKWVADELGLVLVQSANFADPVEAKPKEWNLLNVPDGNYELKIPKDQLSNFFDNDLSVITTAQYDESLKELWVGTKFGGVLHFRVDNQVELLETLTTGNSKLRSNTIQSILVTAPGKVLIGTDDGLVEINRDKSKLYGKGFNIEAIAVNNGVIWVVSDGEVLEMDKKGDFYYFETDEYMTEGLVKDIAFDSRERLWIASEIVIRYDFDRDNYEVYGPIQEFTSQNVNCIAVDFDDALWVGTQDKGLYFIGKSSTLLAEVILTNPLDCKPNAKNAALQVRASGGKPPYNYNWSGGLTGENPKNIGAGSYSVTVTDEDGNTTEAQAVIEDTQFSVSVAQEKPASLGGGADGQARVSITPDSRGFKILWDNGENIRLAQKLAVGEHSVTITGDKGCSTVAKVQIEEALAPLAVNIEEKQGINCAGAATATIEARASGGQLPYSYQWSKNNLTGNQLNQLSAGEYTVVVQDAEGNTASSSITIAEPQPLKANAIARSAASTNNADGRARASAEGGSGQYTYRWDNGETTEMATQLTAGIHTVTITDAAGCTATATVEINENIQALSVNLDETQKVDCAGGNSAVLEALVSGGKAPFQYQWNTDKGNETKASGLSAGNYQLTVTDVAGNTANASITIAEPEPLTATANARAAASTNNADGKARVSAKGGSGKYTYRWDNGESAQIAEKLAAGTHIVTITDEAGCTTTASVDITENILELSVSVEEVSSIKCTGEKTATLQVVAAGGKPPFQYQWSVPGGYAEQASGLGAGTYEITLTDAAGNSKTAQTTVSEPAPLGVSIQQTAPASTNNSDGKAMATAKGGTGNYSYRWDTGASTANSSNLSPGTHDLTVTDQNGCTAIASIEITENILPLSVNIRQTGEINCQGEKTAALEVEIQGGKSPFSYQWNVAEINGSSATGLGPGAYSLTVTDAGGGRQEGSITISEPAALQVSLGKPSRATNEDSKDGKVSLTVSGGTPEYTIVWDNEEAGSKAEKLTVGNHSVTITDANGCKVVETVEIKKKILPALTAGRLSAGQTLQVSQIFFDADSTSMKPDSYPVVNEIADFLEENPLVVIEVGGHTNNIPPHEFCDQLSTGRAKAVAEYIVKRGVDPNRVVYKGYGKRKPRFSNKTDDGRRRNQRVEIKILRLN